MPSRVGAGAAHALRDTDRRFERHHAQAPGARRAGIRLASAAAKQQRHGRARSDRDPRAGHSPGNTTSNTRARRMRQQQEVERHAPGVPSRGSASGSRRSSPCRRASPTPAARPAPRAQARSDRCVEPPATHLDTAATASSAIANTASRDSQDVRQRAANATRCCGFARCSVEKHESRDDQREPDDAGARERAAQRRGDEGAGASSGSDDRATRRAPCLKAR